MDIVEEILRALESEERVMLATIISTSGSTPAAAFSRMIIKDGGKSSVGTVGGGCMEGDVLEAAVTMFREDRSQILTFHLNEDDMVQGLICGGSLDVFIEPITRHHVPLFQELKALRDEGEDCIIATILGTDGSIRAKDLVRHDDTRGVNGLMDKWIPKHQSSNPRLTGGEAPIQLSTENVHASVSRVFHRGETYRLRLPDAQLILEPVTGRPHLIIFGGGHVSKYISQAASMAGFRVTVVDDRPQYANPQRFPAADQTLAVEYYEAFSRLSIKLSSYIVIVTRGHRSDEEILEEAIKTPARYIGMIGSKRKVLTTYEHLVERGVPTESLKRVHAPMGLEIGAVTAEEIGVSVVAELIRVRRGENIPLTHKSEEMLPLLSNLRNPGR